MYKRQVLIPDSRFNDTDLKLFTGDFIEDGERTIIFVGLVGSEAAGPPSGSATWTGEGFANIFNEDLTTDVVTGTALVTANAAGEIHAELNALSGDTDLIDRIRFDDVGVSGTSFRSTSITTEKDGSTIDVVGPNSVGEVAGIFSGATLDSAPDEVGGLFTLTGDNATLVGGFVAD